MTIHTMILPLPSLIYGGGRTSNVPQEKVVTEVVNIYHHVVPELGRTLVGLPASRWPGRYVYIGRSGKGLSGEWGNPVEIGKPCPRCGAKHDRDGAIDCYRSIMAERLFDEPELSERIKALAGKTLVCFCHPKRCHGDVLAELIN